MAKAVSPKAVEPISPAEIREMASGTDPLLLAQIVKQINTILQSDASLAQFAGGRGVDVYSNDDALWATYSARAVAQFEKIGWRVVSSSTPNRYTFYLPQE